MGYLQKRAVYDALPLPVKRLICKHVPFAWLGGRPYREAFSRGRMMYRADADVLRRWQQKPLRDLLLFATENIPAYRSLNHAATLLPPFEALARFPLLTKDEIQAKLTNYLPTNLASIPHYSVTTGGTSGNQFTLLHDEGSQAAETGFMHRLWQRVDYRPGMRKATFRGVPFPHLGNNIYWQENPIYGELQFSPYHMNRDTLPYYWAAIQRYRPEFFHGYPSAISLFAQWLKQSGISATTLGIKAILLGSEGADPGQRALIKDVFGARVFSWYGHSERVILAGECEQSEAYHTFPDYGILEILDPATGRPVEIGQTGELVGTGLFNLSQPLIRYRTGDFARRLPSHCACGRHVERFDQVQGRWEQSFVIGRQGSRISLAALNMHGPCFENVERYQYHQTLPGQIDLRIVPGPAFAEADTTRILAAFTSKLGDALDVHVRIVPAIALTARGKLNRLIQDIPTSEMPSL